MVKKHCATSRLLRSAMLLWLLLSVQQGLLLPWPRPCREKGHVGQQGSTGYVSQLFIDTVIASGATLLPIDSEHNAIFQCLPAQHKRFPNEHGVSKILLTASGGPFLHRPVDTLDSVTPEQAIAHPRWVMGRKISVDSATMMNKGLEVIEAHWLFGIPASQIEVVIHPQSVIHSMVSYIDGSVIDNWAIRI